MVYLFGNIPSEMRNTNLTEVWFTKLLIVLLWLGAQEPALHAGAEEPLLPHGGVQEEICGSIPSCGNSQGRLQVQWVTAGKPRSTITCSTYWHSLSAGSVQKNFIIAYINSINIFVYLHCLTVLSAHQSLLKHRRIPFTSMKAAT